MLCHGIFIYIKTSCKAPWANVFKWLDKVYLGMLGSFIAKIASFGKNCFEIYLLVTDDVAVQFFI